jgi:8-oxo-dGTP pyrophosphatase MutT (NUDIX family)
MSRDKLLAKLRTYQNQWTEEAATVARFIDFVSNQAACFERELACGHVTASAWVVNSDKTKVLLTHHRKLNKWLQLGGHADGDSDIFEVARREVWEESGLSDVALWREEIFDLDIHPIPARGNEPEHEHYDIRIAMQAIGSEAYVVSDESHDLRWVPIIALRELTQGESMLRMGRKWLQDIGQPLPDGFEAETV